YQSIAAASILAKTHRDEYMIQLSAQFPQYDWQQNKGYPTQKHRQAIQQFGVTIHHRRSFKLESE
ncbi:MAG: ribonuclease HII, partial [Saprospiraceae bacterium]|nr:ribonuclease HII [Saprospiraceae bacterium]